MIHTCVKFLLKAKLPFSGGRESDGLESSDKPDELDKEQQKSPNADPKWIWAMYQRKWYVARAATNEEIPKSLANKLSKAREKSMVVQFAIDEKYSIIPTRKIEPFGNNLDLDLKRSKLDPRGYSIAKNEPNEKEEDESSNEQTEKEETESSQTSGLLSHIASKISVVPKLMYKPFGEMDAILDLMIINDQRIHFESEYEVLNDGKDVAKNSDIYSLSPFMDNDGIIKMHTRLTELLAEQYKYPIILAKGRLAELIIWDCHERLLHSGPEQTKRDTRA